MLVLALIPLRAEPLVSADLVSSRCVVGGVATVNLSLSGNPGIHGLYFDLSYDAKCLAFEGLEPGSAVRGIEAAGFGGELLHAVADAKAGGAGGAHLVASYALGSPDAVFTAEGVLAQARFRVLKVPDGGPVAFRFRPQGSGIFGAGRTALSDVRFRDSADLDLAGRSGAYVRFTAPLGNDVVGSESVRVCAISTEGSAYRYRLRNEDTGFNADSIDASRGSLDGLTVPLAFGLNRLRIELLDATSSVLAEDALLVHRAEDQAFVAITSPTDHSLVNSDMVSVTAASIFDTVRINDQAAVKADGKSGGKNLFSVRLWLKNGFNRITAKALGPEGQRYTHTILVFYQKDDGVFRLVSPGPGTVIKADGNDRHLVRGSLIVAGEIGSAFQSPDLPNRVSLRVLFTPRNPSSRQRVLVKDRPLPIRENTLDGPQAPYMFSNDFEIPVAGLESGDLDIIAYKNLDGGRCDAEVHQLVHLDRNQLSIDLVQPNIHAVDVLDSPDRVKGFNHGIDPFTGEVRMENDGRMALQPTRRSLQAAMEFAGKEVVSQVCRRDGSRYALVNDNHAMKLYRKAADSAVWGSPVALRDDLYGYTLCDTDMGILLGVSNLFGSADTGLFLYDWQGESGTFRNVRIGQPIPYVQFIENRNGTIYLYGNDYSSLYSFGLHSLEESGSALTAASAGAAPLGTELSLKAFVLSGDARTVVLLAQDGRAEVFQLDGNGGYSRAAPDNGQWSETERYAAVIKGESSQGSHATYLFLKHPDAGGRVAARALMEDRESHRLVMADGVDGLEWPGERLLGAAYADGHFEFLHGERIGAVWKYRLRRATVFFDLASYEPGMTEFDGGDRAIACGPRPDFSLWDSGGGNRCLSAFLVESGGESKRGLFELVSEYRPAGEVAFDYANPDLESISGFSFQVDPIWLNTDRVQLAFAVRGDPAKGGPAGYATPGFGAPQGGLRLANLSGMDHAASSAEGAPYVVTHWYDAQSARETVQVAFREPVPGSSLSFAWLLRSAGARSAAVANLSVHKISAVKVPRNGESTILLPIQGWIADPTVSEIRIQQEVVKLERGGYFACDYRLKSNEPTATIQLSCVNGAGEQASLSFGLRLFDSVNTIGDVSICDPAGPLVFDDASRPGQASTDADQVLVSGRVFGLEGLVAGYETWAYAYVNGKETLKKIASGVFKVDRDERLQSPDPAYGAGYLSGSFGKGGGVPVSLLPGRQRLVVYVENPGGRRAEFRIGGACPDITYTLPESRQRIVLLNPDIQPMEPAESIANVQVDKQLALSVVEQPAPPYAFMRGFTINGRVDSLFRISQLKVKSPDPAVSFENGTQEILIPVDGLNQFSVRVSVRMPENQERGEYPVLFIPSAPFLEWMKTGLVLKAAKDFAAAHFMPDFSPMDAANWTEGETVAMRKELVVRVGRPLPDRTSLSLTVNYEKLLGGMLRSLEGQAAAYRLVDVAGRPVALSGLKGGVNRIHWALSRNGIAVCSADGVDGRNDYFLTLPTAASEAPATVSFPIDRLVYYDNNQDDSDGALALPDLLITKRASMSARVYLNEALVREDSVSTNLTVGFAAASPRQGRNRCTVVTTDRQGNPTSRAFEFLYDSKAPSVGRLSCTYGKGYGWLSTLSLVVTEANLKAVELYLEDALAGTRSLVNSPCRVVGLGDDQSAVHWDGLESLEPVLQPDERHRLVVVVTDQAGRMASSEPFTGLRGDTTVDPEPVEIDLTPVAWRGVNPAFPREAENWGDRDFAERMKVFNPNVVLVATPSIDSVIQRPGVITVGSLNDGGGLAGDARLSLQSSTGVRLAPGFRAVKGSILSIPAPSAIVPSFGGAPEKVFTRNGFDPEYSVSFWFRHEAEGYYAADTGRYRRILTIASWDEVASGSRREIFLAIMDNDPVGYGDETLSLVERRWTGDGGTDDGMVESIGGNQVVLGTTHGALQNWHLVTLGVRSGDSGSLPAPVFTLSVDYAPPVSLDCASGLGGAAAGYGDGGFPASASASLFGTAAGGHDIRFGELPGQAGRNGHYSIARPFFIARSITNAEVRGLESRLDLLFGNGGSGFGHPSDRLLQPQDWCFDFDSDVEKYIDNAGDGWLKLRMVGDYSYLTGSGSAENANYAENNASAPSHRSLRASGALPNRIKLTKDGRYVFRDAAGGVADHLDVRSDGIWMSLVPRDMPLLPGRYSFGDTFGSHSLANSRWYSVYGTAAALSGAIDADLVLVVNGVERRYPIPAGDFHFVFGNQTAKAPTSVIMYVEARSGIKIKEVFLTEGNFTLPREAIDGLAPAWAVKSVAFPRTGSLDFWYKPMVANDEGFVDMPLTLLDSEFCKIHTASDGTRQTYRLAFTRSGKAAQVTLDSGVPVRSGWHHLQLSWSLDPNSGAAAYVVFTVDGKTARRFDVSAGACAGYWSRSMSGVFDRWQLHLGASADGLESANGYIDEFRLQGWKRDSLFQAREPLSIGYDDGFVGDIPHPRLMITRSVGYAGCTVSSMALRLIDQDGKTVYSNADEDIDRPGLAIAKYPAGAYHLRLDCLVNGTRYGQSYRFIKSDKPRFNLRQCTRMVVAGVPSTPRFEFAYDRQCLLEGQSAKYAGIAVTLVNAGIRQTRYVVQDFRDFNHNGRWIMFGGGQSAPGIPEEIAVEGGVMSVRFEHAVANQPLSWEYRPFYFANRFALPAGDDDPLHPASGRFPAEGSFTIGLAALKAVPATAIIDGAPCQYKLDVRLGTEGSGVSDGLSDFSLSYRVKAAVGASAGSAVPAAFSPDGTIGLYYDDICQGLGYGEFTCTLTLLFKGAAICVKTLEIKRTQLQVSMPSVQEKRLEISGFSLLRIDRSGSGTKADLYLGYEQGGFPVDGGTRLEYEIASIPAKAGGTAAILSTGALAMDRNYLIIPGIPVPPGDSRLRGIVREHVLSGGGTADGLVRTMELPVANRADPPEVFFSNSVESRIAYQNVKFSWVGSHGGSYKSDIEYSYNFDGMGWSADSSSWRSVEFFNLAEGRHVLRVRAMYGAGNYSPEIAAVFQVDVSRPSIDPTKLTVRKVYDETGYLRCVNLEGAAGAILDGSLSGVTVNGIPAVFDSAGGFIANGIPITIDGDNTIVLSAVDSVGNFRDHELTVANQVTELLYPLDRSTVRYAPLTMAGRLAGGVNAPVEIYVRDPRSPRNGSWKTWHKARLNEDFTFFVDDISVTPGSAEREVTTPLDIAVVTGAGTVYTRHLDLFAKEVLRPIELSLSSHAVEGGRGDTTVTISAAANVPDISSWSIDFNGDGIYDDIRMADPGQSFTSQQWQHAYSTMGQVTPRVRAITRDGAYFTATDGLVIHEGIKEASTKSVVDPVALSALTMPDGSQRLHVLAGDAGDYRIDVYEVGRNDSHVSSRLFRIGLGGSVSGLPVKIAAVDADTILVGANKDGRGTVVTLRSDGCGAWAPVEAARLDLGAAIADLCHVQGRVYLSTAVGGTLWSVDLAGSMPVPVSMKPNEARLPGDLAIGARPGLSGDGLGILVADYYHQRLLRLSDGFASLEHMGGQGHGEGQFIKPSIVLGYQNRVFVYDEGRRDIQVFDQDFRLVTRLDDEQPDPTMAYLDQQFLDGLVGLSAFGRVENGRLYHYAVLLSSKVSKLAVLRLPQWEELRARIRNNRLIFLKDKEVYSAKPSGADLARLLSTDSIPRVSGTVDAPALSPDGRLVAFISRAELHDGTGTASGGPCDRLYLMGLDSSGLRRIPLAPLQDFEIERPVFNSNGTRILFSAKPAGGKWQIYSYDLAAGGVSRLFASDENARFPCSSPDDRFIAFTTDHDGDEEVQILDTRNPSMRVSVSSNRCRDSYPVWSATAPGEIPNPDLKIESKIAFVSERNQHKGVYCVYLARPSEADIRVVKKTGEDIGSNPDMAAYELTALGQEGDHPCFTGDGAAVVFERYHGSETNLARRDLSASTAATIGVVGGARLPSGMKNTIASFAAEVADGDGIRLSWDRYTDGDVFYTVRFRMNRAGERFAEKRVFTQDHAVLTGLEMGAEYLVRVCIIENDEEAAASQWLKVRMPEVVAKPTVTVDKDNPYLVRLSAWKPKPETDWGFSWIIDNQEIQVQSSLDYQYEFATGGAKTIILKAHNRANTCTSVSGPVQVDIVSDIHPAVEYQLADDRSWVELSARNSLGRKIDWTSAVWTVTGPGVSQAQRLEGSKGIVNIDGFRNKINVNLKLSRVPVIGQTATDVREANMVIDLDYRDSKLVITQDADAANPRLVTFSGSNSIGNINWREAKWVVFRDGQSLFQTAGVSSFAFEFPESGAAARYSASLGVPRLGDGQTATASSVVSIAATPIEPVIDYEVLELKDATGKVTGAKIVFSAGNSKGSNIDYAQAKWTVPVAGAYGEQPTQIGPTAVYNLFNVGSDTQAAVSLTLMRRGGSEALTVTRTIPVRGGEANRPELVVKCTTRDGGSGRIFDLDVLSSTGLAIDWEKTSWLLSANVGGSAQLLTQSGPCASIEIPASAENAVIAYTVTLRASGAAAPMVKRDEIRIDAAALKPVISADRVGGSVYNLSVTETAGVNIDWERTCWYIYDGADSVTQKYGSRITHAFVRQDRKMGYPVVVVMYFKGNAKPFKALKDIDIEADSLIPSITWDRTDADAGTEILFDASASSGSGIDWSQARWTFGDGSPAQYGAAVGHRYPATLKATEYKVSLTLSRKLANGATECATRSTTVNLGKDEIRPVVKAVLNRNGYLVLSAEESAGRGLLLDRSVWMFAGKGDNENSNVSAQAGVSVSNSWNSSSGSSSGGGAESSSASTSSTGTSLSVSGNVSLSSGTSFTNENYHTGMTARRWVGDFGSHAADGGEQRMLTLSLSVYRQDADGGMSGKTITVNVNLAEAAKAGGVTYR